MEQVRQVRDRGPAEEWDGKQDQVVVVWEGRLPQDQAAVASAPVAAIRRRTQLDNRAIKCNVRNVLRQ